VKSFIVAIFIGTISAATAEPYLGEKVWSLKSVQDHRTDSVVQKGYGDHSTKAAVARPPYQSNVQQRESSESSDSDSDDEAENIQTQYFKPTENGKMGGKYTRVVPARFSGDDDDLLLRSVFNNYALEGETKDGLPDGTFWMDKKSTMSLSREVLGTHLALSGKALDSYLATYFDKAWSHFDVNRTGYVEAIKMPVFERFLTSNQYIHLGE
jgi:hypothetical protein